MKSMKRWIPALIIVAGVLVAAGVVASKAATSHASDAGTGAKPETHAQAQATEGVAFIGISLAPLSAEDAAEAGLDGGALIAHVVPGGPADGLLQAGDIVLAVDGTAVASPGEVVGIVRTSQPDEVLAFSVHRDGASLDVEVTAGVETAGGLAFRRHTAPNFTPFGPPHLRGSKNLIKSEVTMETDDGVQTVRTAVGTVGDLDVDAGTFSLTLKDGSETIDYLIGGETKVRINHAGDLSGLNTDDLTTVVDVTDGDGGWEVRSVTQGSHAGHRLGNFTGRMRRHFGRPSTGIPGPQFRLFQGMPHDGEGFRNFSSPGTMNEFFQTLPDDVHERFEGFHMEHQIPETEDDIIVEGTQS